MPTTPSTTEDPCSPSTPLLLQRAKAGDTTAFQALYECYARALFTFFLGYTADEHLAEEMVNDTFLRVWQALGRYREEGRFRGWLFRIARNIATDRHRRRQRRPPEVLVDEDTIESLTHPTQLANELIARQQALDDTYEALQHLQPDYRTVLLLRFIEGLSVRETARAMERSEGAVRVLQFRALKALREHLKPDL